MARTIGIDAGDYSVKAVELDGSYRKTRLVRCRVERVAATAGDADRAVATAAAIQQALREGRLGGDLVLGHPCREAVLRTIEVPFTGNDAIRKVIKAEVEGAIHSHAVDDMVVDFHVVGKANDNTRVLVAAVPKQGLRSILEALRTDGIDPEHVDLDIMALYRAADWCGAFSTLAETVPAEGAPAETVPAQVPAAAGQVAAAVAAVLDLGSRSTRVLLVENGRLIDMRTLRLGDAAVAEALARAQTLSLDDARTALQACLTTGGDYETTAAAALPAAALPATALPAAVPPAEGGSEAAPPAPVPEPARRVVVTRAAVEAEQTAFLQRLARELVRFLTSSGKAGGIQALWITGGGSRMAGMKEMLAEVFDREPRELDVIGRLQHSLPPEEAEALAPQIVTAVGLALSGLGGPEGFNFRQEDLAFTRGFDRLKFPLAITCMVALFALVVYAVSLNNELKKLEFRLGLTYEKDPKKPQFYGMLYSVLHDGWFSEDRYFQLHDNKGDYGYRQLLQELVAKPVPERVKLVRDRLQIVCDAKQKDSGIFEEVTLESGLAVLVRLFEVLKDAEPGMGKYLLCSLKLNMKVGTGVTGNRSLDLVVAFRGENFRTRQSALRDALDAECKRPDSPFQKLEDIRAGEHLFDRASENYVEGAYYDVKLVIRDAFAPFGEVKG